MPFIARSSIEEIRNRVDIVDVVQNIVNLKRSGGSYKGLSPFTQEKTPSFFVHPEKQFFYCFSTSTGGDVFRFVQLTEDVGFNEAAEIIAKRYGIDVEYENGSGPSPESRSLRKELLEIHEQACEFYHMALMAEHSQSEQARQYWLENRKFSIETAKEFKVGFAPPKTDKLNKLMKQKGFSMDALKQCGIFYSHGNEQDPMQLKPRFRGRLMIPIREAVQGEVIAFTARKMDCTPKDDPAFEAKYINSPETKLFYKSNILFNLERARKEAIKDGTPFVMVEGQLDAIRCWEQGIKTAIAPQGTSITEAQLSRLKRYGDHLEVILDGDSAGQKAALRMLPLSLQSGLEVQFIPLPQGSDPDSILVEQGVEAFLKLKESKISAMHFASQAILPKPQEATAQLKASAMRKLFEIIAQSESEIVRNDYIEEAAQFLLIESNVAKTDFVRFLRNQNSRPGSVRDTPQIKNSASERLTTAEADLLYLVLHHDGLAELIAEVIDSEWIDSNITEGKLLAHIVSDIQENLWEDLDHMISQLQDEGREVEMNMLYALRAQSNANNDNTSELIEDILNKLFEKFRTRKLNQIALELKRIPPGNDDFKILLNQRNELLKTKQKPPEFPEISVP